MTFEECFVEAFLEHVEAEVTPVQPDARVRGASRGHPRGQEQFGANRLGHVTAILNGVVQRELVEAVEILMIDELVEVQRKGRLLVVHRLVAAGGAF